MQTSLARLSRLGWLRQTAAAIRCRATWRQRSARKFAVIEMCNVASADGTQVGMQALRRAFHKFSGRPRLAPPSKACSGALGGHARRRRGRQGHPYRHRRCTIAVRGLCAAAEFRAGGSAHCCSSQGRTSPRQRSRWWAAHGRGCMPEAPPPADADICHDTRRIDVCLRRRLRSSSIVTAAGCTRKEERRAHHALAAAADRARGSGRTRRRCDPVLLLGRRAAAASRDALGALAAACGANPGGRGAGSPG